MELILAISSNKVLEPKIGNFVICLRYIQDKNSLVIQKLIVLLTIIVIFTLINNLQIKLTITMDISLINDPYYLEKNFIQDRVTDKICSSYYHRYFGKIRINKSIKSSLINNFNSFVIYLSTEVYNNLQPQSDLMILICQIDFKLDQSTNIEVLININFLFYYYRLQNKLTMEDSSKEVLTNKELNMIKRYRSRIKQVEEQSICDKIINRDINHLEFYKITPKEELPKFLQKMKFQTLHFKEKDITSSVKVYKNQNKKPIEQVLRKKLKQDGHIMLLSEIYEQLGQPCHLTKKKSMHNLHSQPELPNQLDQWEKTHKVDKKESPNKKIAKANTEIQKCNASGGYDYQGQIEKGLEIIQMTHGSQTNLLNRYMLIQNSSKLLKKQLEDKKLQVEQNIKDRMKLLFEARTEYHTCFEERNRLRMEEKILNEESREDMPKISHKSISIKTQKGIKRNLFEANEARIARYKKTIEGLEEAIANLQEELKKIMQAQILYYKITLKNGTDVRQNGLMWVIRKLQMKESDIAHYEFPSYLDRKSKLFLIHKAQNQAEEQQLLQNKKRFVNEIGRTASENKIKIKMNTYSKDTDKIVENEYKIDGNIPKKYRRSQRKMSALAQEFLKNSSLLDLKAGNRGMEISCQLQGMNHKQIYSQVGERIKKLDLTKIRKEKMGSKGSQLMEYQSILQKIKSADIKCEEMDLQHQHYLLSQYHDNRDLFFMEAAASFGYKRAYSMIIKHFSWKNYNDQHHFAKRDD